MSGIRDKMALVTLLAGLGVFGCGQAEPPAGDGGLVPPQPFLTAEPGQGEPAGVVLEVLNAQGYTYARVAIADEEVWVAGPSTQIVEGDSVSLAGADNMGPFTSPSLDRTFDQIFFVNEFRFPGAARDLYRGTVTETMNAAGYTYAQVEVDEEFAWMVAQGSPEPLVWLAGPETGLKVGDVLTWQGGSIMRDFHSPTLNRTFQEIVFVGAFTPAS